MSVEQIYTNCLSEASYFIQSKGEAAVIDPIREPTPYIERAESNHVKIKYIFLTHFHADFVSGHLDLAHKTGAKIVFGPSAKADFDFYEAKDGETFKVGNIHLELMHTPGHTMESSSLVYINEKKEKEFVFTGDTLFIGDVGRPDLAVNATTSKTNLAELLFDSLRNKIMKLPDDIIIYPNHGPGSSCGKNMSEELFDTLGHQKQINYALNIAMTKEEFCEAVLRDLPAPPQYFSKNILMNKRVNKKYDEIIIKGLTAYPPTEFYNLIKTTNAIIILDTRNEKEFKSGFIPQSYSFNIDSNFAPWIGTVLKDINAPIAIIAEKGREEEVVTRLSRIGYDNAMGYLKGGITAWKEAGLAIDTIASISPNELLQKMNDKITIVDVRKESEFHSAHIDSNNVVNKPLNDINTNLSFYNKGESYYIHCASGFRSMVTASLLKVNGIKNVVDITGGFDAIKASSIKTTVNF